MSKPITVSITWNLIVYRKVELWKYTQNIKVNLKFKCYYRIQEHSPTTVLEEIEVQKDVLHSFVYLHWPALVNMWVDFDCVRTINGFNVSPYQLSINDQDRWARIVFQLGKHTIVQPPLYGICWDWRAGLHWLPCWQCLHRTFFSNVNLKLVISYITNIEPPKHMG